MVRREIVSLNVNTGSYSSAIFEVIELSKKSISSYICFANVHMIVESYRSSEIKKNVNNSTFSFPDGMPLVFAFKALFGIKQDRIAGIDFMIDAIKECEKEKLSVFLFGSTPMVLEALEEKLTKKFPDLLIAGKLSPPFKEFSKTDNDSFIEIINNSNSNMIFVSLGCPKQEMWMAQHFDKIKAPLLGVGAAFEIHAQIVKRAPKWMQKIGMEWLFRFIQEPGRLWKRYMITNSVFLFLLIKELILVRFKIKRAN